MLLVAYAGRENAPARQCDCASDRVGFIRWIAGTLHKYNRLCWVYGYRRGTRGLRHDDCECEHADESAKAHWETRKCSMCPSGWASAVGRGLQQSLFHCLIVNPI